MFNYITLNLEEKSSAETEIRFLVATASVEGLDLIALAYSDENDAVNKKRDALLKRVLNLLKREGKITFYLSYASLDNGSTESEFLKNKYQSFLTKRDGEIVYFVKI